jgi:hypothetical protein
MGEVCGSIELLLPPSLDFGPASEFSLTERSGCFPPLQACARWRGISKHALRGWHCAPSALTSPEGYVASWRNVTYVVSRAFLPSLLRDPLKDPSENCSTLPQSNFDASSGFPNLSTL